MDDSPKVEELRPVALRVFLRKPAETDRREFVALREDNLQHFRPWEPVPSDSGIMEENEGFTRFQELADDPRRYHRLVCLCGTLTIIGVVALRDIVRAHEQSAICSYWCGAGFCGKGYMTDAMNLLLLHAFTAICLNRVEANIVTENRPSIRLVQRLGFTREGYSKRFARIDGQWRDHERWAILKSEYVDHRSRLSQHWS